MCVIGLNIVACMALDYVCVLVSMWWWLYGYWVYDMLLYLIMIVGMFCVALGFYGELQLVLIVYVYVFMNFMSWFGSIIGWKGHAYSLMYDCCV